VKLASITCVRNESDILETFVKVNSSFIDTFIFVDDSNDGTRDLYDLLYKEGYKIVVLDGENTKPPYNQGSMIMKALNYADGFDYYFPLDVDEFPKFKDLEDAGNCIKDIPDNGIGYYFWETYIPLSLDFDSVSKDGLINCFGKRQPEGRTYQKIVISGSLAKKINVAVGAHGATMLDGSTLPSIGLNKRLAHFPVRSNKQIIKKNISAVYGLLRKSNRLNGEGYHVIDTLKKLRNRKYQLSLEDLQSIALEYANNIHCGIGESPDWINSYELKYQKNIDFTNVLLEIMIDSWFDPFDKEKIRDLINNL
jgi:hypothetical protein